MKLKRSRVAYAFGRGLTTFNLNCLYEVNCYGGENIPTEGPALLLPKHQYLKDIPLEGLFLAKKCKRPANWVMKAQLPRILEYTGGIGIIDIKRIKNKEKRRQMLPKIKEHNQKTMDYIEWLYTQGEIIVVHPEGKRWAGEMKPLKREFFDFTKKVQEKYNIKIPAIPMGIEYAPEHRVYLRAGKQLDVDNPDISDVVKEEIRRLSNLE